MRVTLVDNLVFPDPTRLETLDVHPHLGLLSVAATAEAAGHDVTIWDPKRLVRNGDLSYDRTLYEASAERLLADAPEAVGFTSLGCSFLYTLGVARSLRRRVPDLPIVLGGPHATMLAEPILRRYDVFDVVVRHEAEPTIAAVLEALPGRDFRSIPGVSWRDGDAVRETPGAPRVDDLDTLPRLDYDHYPMRELSLGLLRVEAGRGCPFACTFCSTATFFQRRYRLKSADRLVEEMDRLRVLYAPQEFKLDHDLFTVNRGKVEEFCAAVAGHGHRWHVSARADCVDDDLLAAMAAAGCVGLYLGVETGSPRMQKISAKRLDLDLVGPTLDTCERLGIRVTASFITGFPEETASDQAQTLDLLGQCFERPESACLPQLHLLTPEPGTGLAAQFGDELQRDDHATPFNAWLLGDDDTADIAAAPDIFATYYYYPAHLPRSQHLFVVAAVDVLRLLGHDLLAVLMQRAGGLATLVDLLRQYTDGRPPAAEDVAAMVVGQFDADDPVVSAVRYRVFCATPLDCRAEVGTDTACRGEYRSVPGMAFLHDVLDAEIALRAVVKGDPLLDRDRFTYARGAGWARPVRLEPAVADLLSMFGSGRELGEVLRLLGQPARREPEWFCDLVASGLLERVRVS